MAVAALAELLAEPPLDDQTAAARLAEAAAEANSRIHSAASADAARSGMGTTLTALLLRDDHALLAHIGDSRAYLLRGDKLTQLTQDHSLVAVLVASLAVAMGVVTATLPAVDRLTRPQSLRSE